MATITLQKAGMPCGCQTKRLILLFKRACNTQGYAITHIRHVGFDPEVAAVDGACGIKPGCIFFIHWVNARTYKVHIQGNRFAGSDYR